MLKTFLPTFYPNYLNKTCGEIVCQTEKTFSIICKLCDIKLFEYDEFIKHFHNTHWPEICCDGNEKKPIAKRSNAACNDTKNNKCMGAISSEKTRGKEVENDTNILHGKLNGSEEESVNSSVVFNAESDSDELPKTLAILKKAPDTSLETTKEKSFECLHCKRMFTTKFYLRFHMRQQHETKNFHCAKCNKSFAEKRYLTLHQRSHVGYTCQVCSKIFDKYEALRYHGESHIQTRNFVCDYQNCGKAFPNNRRLSAHKRSHFAQPSFVCEICGSLQRSKEFLVVHLRTHTGEKPYACEQCDRRFASKHFLQDHQAVHATERSHVCTICGKAFASSKSLYHHRHLHSGVKKYICKICNSAYSQAAGLSAHMRKHKRDCGILDSEPKAVKDDKIS